MQQFERRGVKTFYNQLGFAPSVLASVPETETGYRRDIRRNAVFASCRAHSFARISRDTHQLNIWGMGIEEVSEKSPIRGCYRGQAWGREMFAIFRRSQIVINQHIGIAGDFANNMRLYEATGCGATLVTDRKANLHELFDVGSEVVDYGDPAECLARIEGLLERAVSMC